MLEARLVAKLQDDFQTRSWATFEEVPFLHRRIDLVAVEPSTDTLIAVEAKVKNWRVAVRQAISCLLCCDYVYIALPEGRVRAVDIDHLRQLGIGLISIGVDVVTVVDPPTSMLKNPYHTETLRGMLQAMLSSSAGGKG